MIDTQVQQTMAQIDSIRAARMAEARADMVQRLPAESVDALLEAGERIWRTDRQTIETRLRQALEAHFHG